MAKRKSRRERLHGSVPADQASVDPHGRIPDPQNLPPDIRQIVQQVIAYQGPLPPSAELQRYNEIVPGAAARILGWVDEERVHRHQIESESLATLAFRTRWGMILGFIITAMGLGGAIYLAAIGREETAKVLGGFTLAAIAAVFVIGRLAKRDPD
jgi:uncharacterized membrane protein